MDLGDGAEVHDLQHPLHQPLLRHHHREPKLAASETLGQLEQETHSDAVDVAGVREVDHETEVVVANRSQELLAHRACPGDVDVTLQAGDPDGVAVVELDFCAHRGISSQQAAELDGCSLVTLDHLDRVRQPLHQHQAAAAVLASRRPPAAEIAYRPPRPHRSPRWRR